MSFAVPGIKMGLPNIVVVFALYRLGWKRAAIVSLLRVLLVARRSKNMFGRCLCAGTVAMIGFHVFENIGMNMGLMPVTGIPLPLISYGGSNMMATLTTIAIVLSVNYRAYNRGQIQ